MPLAPLSRNMLGSTTRQFHWLLQVCPTHVPWLEACCTLVQEINLEAAQADGAGARVSQVCFVFIMSYLGLETLFTEQSSTAMHCLLRLRHGYRFCLCSHGVSRLVITFMFTAHQLLCTESVLHDRGQVCVNQKQIVMHIHSSCIASDSAIAVMTCCAQIVAGQQDAVGCRLTGKISTHYVQILLLNPCRNQVT